MMSVEPRLLAAISRRPLILDAGVGYRLIARGMDDAADDPAMWNLTHTQTIHALHLDDLRAGSDAVLTNTFGANRSWLARFGRGEDVSAINRQGVRLARDAAGPGRFVLGSIGPTAADAPDACVEQAEVLADAGVDGLVLETHRLDQAIAGLRLLRGHFDGPIVVSLCETATPTDALATLVDGGADVVGVNCVRPEDARAWVGAIGGRYRGIPPVPLLYKPGAVSPVGEEISPEAFAAGLSRLADAGVRLFGGCCGATAAHVAAIRSALAIGAVDAV